MIICQINKEVSRSSKQPDDAPCRFKYLDANGEGQITANHDREKVQIGKPNPTFTAGINIGVNYKNFDLSTFSYWSCGNDVLNWISVQTDIFSELLLNTPKSYAALYDSWTPKNPRATITVVEAASDSSTTAVFNSFSVTKDSYFRNKTIKAGYNRVQVLVCL
jgi:hypothetical protein